MTQNNRIRKIWIYLLGIIGVPILLSIVFCYSAEYNRRGHHI